MMCVCKLRDKEVFWIKRFKNLKYIFENILISFKNNLNISKSIIPSSTISSVVVMATPSGLNASNVILPVSSG